LARRVGSLAQPPAAQLADPEQQTAVLVQPEAQREVCFVQRAGVPAPERQAV